MRSVFIFLFLASWNLIIAQSGQEDNSREQDIVKGMTNQETKVFIDRGYKAFFSMGVLTGPAENLETTPYSVLLTNSYTLHKNINLGVVTGYELLNEGTTPLGIDLRLTQAFRNRILYLGLSGGHSFSLEKPVNQNIEEANGGIFVNPEVGLVLPFSMGNGFYMAIGYRYNELHYTREDFRFGMVDRTIYFNRASLKFGVVLY